MVSLATASSLYYQMCHSKSLGIPIALLSWYVDPRSFGVCFLLTYVHSDSFYVLFSSCRPRSLASLPDLQVSYLRKTSFENEEPNEQSVSLKRSNRERKARWHEERSHTARFYGAVSTFRFLNWSDLCWISVSSLLSPDCSESYASLHCNLC